MEKMGEGRYPQVAGDTRHDCFNAQLAVSIEWKKRLSVMRTEALKQQNIDPDHLLTATITLFRHSFLHLNTMGAIPSPELTYLTLIVFLL